MKVSGGLPTQRHWHYLCGTPAGHHGGRTRFPETDIPLRLLEYSHAETAWTDCAFSIHFG
jgi:hypothetical protein